MKWRFLLSMLVAILVFSACSLFSTSSQGTAVAPAPAATAGARKEYQYVFAPPSAPVNLTVALDAAHAAEAVIPVKGGQLKATGADGTLYTLDIPAEALLANTRISLTPAASVSGLPFGGKQTYAVQLAPEGLYLYRDTLLTITPPQPLPIDQQIFFGYRGSGQALGLAAPVLDAQVMKIHLQHFSGYGVTQGTQADVTPQLQQLGGDPLSRIQDLTAACLDNLRAQNGTLDATSAQAQGLIDLINQYEEQVVKPSLEAAQSSCDAGKNAIRTVLDLERTRQLLGLSTNLNTDISALITSVAKVCVKEEYQKCVDQHIIHRMIPLWLGLKRQFQLLGGSAQGPEPEEVKLAEELTAKCLTFELQFESKGQFDAGGGGYNSDVKSKIRLQFDPSTFTIQGEAPLDNPAFKFIPPAGCTATSTPGGGTFQVVSLEYIEDTHSPTDPVGYVRDFKLVYSPGVSSESYHVDCPARKKGEQESHYTSPPSGYWSGIFFTLHAQELNAAGGAGSPPPMPDLSALLTAATTGAMPALPAPPVPEGGGFVAGSWDVPSGDLFAEKEWISDNPGAGITESGNFKLYHRPGG